MSRWLEDVGDWLDSSGDWMLALLLISLGIWKIALMSAIFGGSLFFVGALALVCHGIVPHYWPKSGRRTLVLVALTLLSACSVAAAFIWGFEIVAW